jgi:hypothetical protein
MVGKGEFRLVMEDGVLSLFARERSAARKAYLRFLADGLSLSLRNLSMGGRRTSQALDDSLTDEDLYDDRILGGGLFVERVLGEGRPVEANRSLDDLMRAVAAYYGLNCDELSRPGKVRKIADAKAVICYLAVRHCRMVGSAVGKELSYTPSAVSRAVQRGAKIFEEDEGLSDLLV